MRTGRKDWLHGGRMVMAMLLLFLLLTSSKNVWATSSFAWTSDKTVSFGDTGRLAPGLTFPSGTASLWGTDVDLYVTQNLPNVTFSSPAGGGLIDLGTVPYDKVPPLNGDLKRELPAVTGHVYLYFRDSMVVKFQVARITKGTGQYDMPTVNLKYATGTLDLFEILPEASGYDYGEVAPQPQPNPQPTPQPTPQPQPQAGTPANVKAVFQDGAVVLTWTAAYPAPSKGYYVYRGLTQDFKPVTPEMDFPTLLTTYTDTKATVGQTYYYLVQAIDGGTSQVVKVEATAPVQQVITRVIRMTLNSKVTFVNNIRRELDVAPQTIQGRMMVPLRPLGEALGAAVDFDGSTNKVTYRLDGSTLLLWLNQQNASLNGVTKTMDVPPTLVDSRTLIPLRFVSEALGASVEFDAATSTATISYTPKSQPVVQTPAPISTPPETTEVDTVNDLADYSAFYGKWKIWISGNFTAPDPTTGYSTYMSGGYVGYLNLYQDGTFVWEISGDPYKQGTWGAHPSGNGNLILDVDTGSMFADYSMKMNADGTIEFWSFDLKHTGTRVE